MSELKVNKISPRSGTDVQIGDTGDTVTLPAGAVGNADLENNSITINGSSVALGGSITVQAALSFPTISGISPSTITNSATDIVITGTNFVSIPRVEAISSTGAIVVANSVSFTSATSITANFTITTDGTYYIRVENNDGLAVRTTNADLTVSDAPTWTTAAGSLGTFAGNYSGTLATVVATSDSAVTFSEVGSNLATANVTLSSGGVLSTTDFGGTSTQATTYNFTIRATDAEGQTADRAFSLTSSFEATGGGQFN